MALASLGVDRLLTSGRAASAWEGRENIARLVAALDHSGDVGSGDENGSGGGDRTGTGTEDAGSAAAGGDRRPRLVVVAGAGVHAGNAVALVRHSGAREVHAGSALASEGLGERAKYAAVQGTARVAPTTSRPPSGSGGVSMGAGSAGCEHLVRRVDAGKVRALVASLGES